MSMTEGCRQSIRSIRLGRARQAKQLGDHMLYLGLVSRACTDYRLLDLPGSIFVDIHSSVYRCHNGSTPGLAQLEC